MSLEKILVSYYNMTLTLKIFYYRVGCFVKYKYWKANIIKYIYIYNNYYTNDIEIINKVNGV